MCRAGSCLNQLLAYSGDHIWSIFSERCVGYYGFLCCIQFINWMSLPTCIVYVSCQRKLFTLNLLYVHCFHYVDCLRIVRSWVILNMLQWIVKMSILEPQARDVLDSDQLFQFHEKKINSQQWVKLMDGNKTHSFQSYHVYCQFFLYLYLFFYALLQRKDYPVSGIND